MTAFDDDNPVIFIEHTALYAIEGRGARRRGLSIPFGQAEILREGEDVTLIGYSGSVHQATAPRQHLAERWRRARRSSICARCVRSTSRDPASVRKKTNRAIIVEDDWEFGGFAGEIAAIIQEQAFDDLDAPVSRCRASPMPYVRRVRLP